MNNLVYGMVRINKLFFFFQPTTSWFDDETLFGVYPNGLRDGQPRIYKRSLYEKVTKTLLNHKKNAYEKHSTAN